MSRNPVSTAAPKPATHAPQHSAPAHVPGGASGVPHQQAPVAPQQAAPRPPLVKPQRFRVLNGGIYAKGGLRTALRAGKVVTAQHYDLDHLRDQGFRLEALDAPPEPQAAPAEAAPVVNEGKNPFPPESSYDKHESQWTPTEKLQAVGLLRAGKSVAEVCGEKRVSAEALEQWSKQEPELKAAAARA